MLWRALSQSSVQNTALCNKNHSKPQRAGLSSAATAMGLGVEFGSAHLAVMLPAIIVGSWLLHKRRKLFPIKGRQVMSRRANC